jgi:hypothetical protein
MQTAVDADGAKAILTLKITLKYDDVSGGYFVVEQDGPSHEIAWGPMPYNLVEAYMRERADQMVDNAKLLMSHMVSSSGKYVIRS